jgi:hypothetical protein
MARNTLEALRAIFVPKSNGRVMTPHRLTDWSALSDDGRL